ncbi:hypothetical protein M404DRAFT_999254 [Pisolithus tinctorius Marx 270]|uniref:Uncharacterized protein n=1 Tax=Pisolithus tinctorius Marx 270 TaxID=870435 RepID=A0A0C3PD66_PISTI|nr:hypothetical protein M404DRAFT_999254 [Pisolithus tinctorius Marx 270]
MSAVATPTSQPIVDFQLYLESPRSPVSFTDQRLNTDAVLHFIDATSKAVHAKCAAAVEAVDATGKEVWQVSVPAGTFSR